MIPHIEHLTCWIVEELQRVSPPYHKALSRATMTQDGDPMTIEETKV